MIKLPKKFFFYRQLDKMDCGPTCLRMIAKYYGKNYSIKTLRELLNVRQSGTTLQSLIGTSNKIGFETQLRSLAMEQLTAITLPCILHWDRKHFVVLPPQDFNFRKKTSKILIADPAFGMVRLSQTSFLKAWMGDHAQTGYALSLEPVLVAESFIDGIKSPGLFSLYKHLVPYKKYISLILIGMLFISLFSLILPFFTQNMVDVGINNKDYQFIYLMFYSQLFIFIGTTAIETIRSWITIHMSSRINISLVSSFLKKLMKLPMHFFDTRFSGDIMQRVLDNSRIDQFLTSTVISSLFSVINLIAFSIVLISYNVSIFYIFITGSVLSILWISFFMRRRRHLDYEKFSVLGNNQNNIIEMIAGIQEIKINGAEQFQYSKWEKAQGQLFKTNLNSLAVGQLQNLGYLFFTQLKNIVISFIAAKGVIDGSITMGMMLSISYISGQLNGPVNQLLSSIQSAQDSKLSLERLSEVHLIEHEDSKIDEESEYSLQKIEGQNLILSNLNFKFPGDDSPLVLKDINLEIPYGKVTAIVGPSGSGKTTLMKILLKFYEPSSGGLTLGNKPLESLSSANWRRECGVVLSDGYIFSDTIAKNICLCDTFDEERLTFSLKMAALNETIEGLRTGVATIIGASGQSLSSGQKQRVLLARAIYKNPKFLFLDEATSSLDANTENVIHSNLSKFYCGKTVFIIAHRLSTVMQADQIIVLDKGQIVEVGNHDSLTKKRDKYYHLVKNQLSLQN